MRISDWSSDVCSSDLGNPRRDSAARKRAGREYWKRRPVPSWSEATLRRRWTISRPCWGIPRGRSTTTIAASSTSTRSEEHTSELQSLMRISYAVFCLKKKTIHIQNTTNANNLDALNKCHTITHKIYNTH